MSLTVEEERVVAAVAARRADLVELAADLVRHDTITHLAGAPARQERPLQELVAARMRAAGAQVDLWEPDPQTLADHPYVPAGFSFAGRPQLAARFAGAGGGRSLLLCGHVDVVSGEPLADWSSPPFSPQIRDGRLYGRGACDMKGGVAAMIVAAETLAQLGVRLSGDLIVSTVTEEESTGAGGLALVRRGWRADAALVPEPTGLAVSIACRGSLCPSLHVEGRAGHAGLPSRHPSLGGAVNAIEKAMYLLEGLRRLRDEWALSTAHRYLAPADIVPTIIAGGDWIVSHASSCTVELHVEYLPTQTDRAGRGSLVQAEISDWIARIAAADPWLAEHPPRIEWATGDVPPAEMPADHPLAQATLGAALDLGSASQVAGFQNWHDGATLTVEAGIPSLCFGPGDIGLAHAVDEHVPLAELVVCAQGIALTAMRFCAASIGETHSTV